MFTARVLTQSKTLPQRVVRAARSVDSENLALICSSALFQGLTDWECKEIAYYAGKRIFARNQALFVQGDSIRELILLKTGRVKHTQVASNGNEVLFRFCTAGDFANVFTGSASYIHTCSARATRPTVALVWDFARMHGFLEQCPQMRDNIIGILAVQLQQMENRFCELATECLTRRLALVVSRLALQIGRATSEGILISITREELAQMAGTTVFSVSRQLSTWSAQGSVLCRREAVIVRETNCKHFDDARLAAMHYSSIRMN